MPRPRSWVMALALLAAACSGVAPRPPALTQNRELEGFAAAAAYPNAEPAVALLAAQQYLAAHREQEGYELFQRLAREQARPPDPALAGGNDAGQDGGRRRVAPAGRLGRGGHPQA